MTTVPREEQIALMTVEEAATALHSKVKVSAIRQAIRDGRLDATRIGKRYFVTPEALRRFARCPVPASRPASGKGATVVGLSLTAGSSSPAEALLASAIEALPKPPSRSISRLASRSAQGQRSQAS